MKTILCFGDSNMRGVIPELIDVRVFLTQRYIKTQRWTGMLQKQLGENYDVIEEGMGGRTTMFDEIIPGRPYRNGLTQLPVCLESHYPIDLVIFMLGTNDTKIQFKLSGGDIANGMLQLTKMVQASNKGPSQKAPKILIIAPPPICKIKNLFIQFDDSAIEKSKLLAGLYQDIAENENCYFLDAGLYINSSELDGLHLNEDQCPLLADAVAQKIRCIFSDEQKDGLCQK